MTNSKKKKNIFIALGAVALLIGGFFIVKQIMRNALIKEYEEACLAMSGPMEEAINNKDSKTFNSYVHYTEFAQILLGKKVDDATANEMLDSLRLYTSVAEFAENLINEEGNFKFMKYYFDGNHGHLIFRLFGNYGALMYLDYEIKKTDRGFKVINYYNITTGNSVHMRAMEMLPSAPGSNDLKCRILKSEMKRQNDIIRRVRDYADLHQINRASNELELLNKDLLSSYLYHHEYMRLAVSSGAAYYTKYAQMKYSQTNNEYYKLIYKFYEKIGTRNPELILTAIDNFTKTFGNDDILAYFSAFAKMQKGEHDAALKELTELSSSYKDIFIFKLAIFNCHFEMDAENAVENFTKQMDLPNEEIVALLKHIAKYIPFEVNTIAADKGLK